LVKYGYASFSFEILEYCNKNDVLVREQYYLDLLKPEYNILRIAGSSLGYLHTEQAKLKMRGTKNMSPEHLVKIREHIFKINSKRALHIEVFDMEKGIKVEYASALIFFLVIYCYKLRRKK
jgi:group I intron endonuclease